MAIFIKGNGAAGGGGGTVDTIQAGTGISVDATDAANPIVSSTVVDTNDAVKVSANDTTAGFLNGKLVAGSNITFTEGNDGSNETLTIAASGGGVTGFTGSQNTASPNDTVNASRLLVDATSTNADFVAQPKGTGALLAQLPDGASTGGNKRGARAVDFQMQRDQTSQIASGLNSSILGGYANTASGSYSIAFGSDCTASGSGSVAYGKTAVASQQGQRSYAVDAFAAYGDCQEETYIQQKQTTTNTQTELTSGGGNVSAARRIAIASDATYTFSGLVTARRTDADNESAGWEIKGVIDNNAGTTALVGSATVTALGDDSSGTWLVAVEADDTNDALLIKVTGENSKTIRWCATVTLMKVAG